MEEYEDIDQLTTDVELLVSNAKLYYKVHICSCVKQAHDLVFGKRKGSFLIMSPTNHFTLHECIPTHLLIYSTTWDLYFRKNEFKICYKFSYIIFFAQTYHLKYSLSLKFFHVFLKNVEPFDILRLVIHYFILDASMLYLLILIVLSIEILSRIQGCCRIVGNLPRDKKRAVKRSVWWTGTTEGGATTQHKTGCTGSGRGWGGRSLSINI